METNRAGLFRAVTGLAVALAGLTALLSAPAHAETTLERIMREGRIKVGIYNEVPTGYVDKNGTLTGEAPEVLRVALATLGDIKMEPFVVDEFGALIPGLLAGRFDVIAAGLYITPERCKVIAYTRPTIKYGEALVVKKGNPLNIHSYEDIARHKTAVVAVAPGSMEQKYAEAAGIPPERTRVIPVSQIGQAALRSGQVDVLAVPAVTGQKMVEGTVQGDIELADPFIDPIYNGKVAISYAALGLRQADKELLEAINAALGDFINTKDHLELVKRFGFSEQQLPGDKTTEEICAGT